jgi:hypothetical protein
MGRYNPHLPQDLGQEWVPIRNEDLVLNPFANSLERGYGFTLDSAQQINNVRFYVNTFPPLFVRNQAYTANIYRRGQEAESGPVRSVIIPCNNGSITGSGAVTSPAGLSVAEVVYNSSGNYFINWILNNGNPTVVSFFFATNSYAQLLNGKRILGVNFLIEVDVPVAFQGNPDDFAVTGGDMTPILTNDAFLNSTFFDGFTIYRAPVTSRTAAGTRLLTQIRMGDADLAFGTNGALTSATPNVSQWTYSELQRFEASSSNRIFMTLGTLGGAVVGANVLIPYVALQVFYCEENRVAFGSRNINGLRIVQARDPFQLGMNQIIVRTPGGSTNPILAAGDYTVTLSEANTGDDFNVAFSPFETAKVNELRQLYEVPTVPGMQVNLPFPLNDEAIDTTFTKESTDLIPQLSLHASGGAVLVDSHAYGRQAVGQVYGSNFVTQDIDDSALTALTSFPGVRYYARRFGTTTAPLKLSSASPTVSGSGMSIQITPAEFDALDEILDGWKAVTLRFPTPPQMGLSQFPTWKWTAAGEVSGSRWEVLGAAAYAASGIAQQMPINLQFGQVPTGQQLYAATYGAPTRGSTINEEWLPQLGPYVSGAAVDQAADACIIFAQDMPTVTGFAVSVASQALTGIGQECGIDPCGIPTAILYNQLSWGPYGNGTYIVDMFSRAATGWGSTDTGQAYTDSGGTVEGNYVTTGTAGTHVLDGAADIARVSTLGVFATNTHHKVKISASVLPTGASVRAGIIFNRVDASNYDFVDFQFATTQAMEIVISRSVAGVVTTVSTVGVGFYGENQQWWAEVDVSIDGTIRAKAWPVGGPEPASYQASAAATFTSSGGGVGLRSIRTTSNTNTDMVISYDDYTVGPSTWNFGYLELQRQDTITEWQTIMKATSPLITGFNDYEARVGMSSDYRIRAADVYDFTGPWSSTVTVNAIAPGVSGSCLSDAHIMIFTTNERQTGSSNLAYSNAWEGTVTEDFSFPEAGFTQLQPMYNRDFFTAFRPTERGGEDFSRTLLVQAAAISPETLADFTSLRNMAWDDVSYICVRDEDGNRWFANINVPSGVVQNRRRLYMATVQIVEVTDVPAQVDP